jgi:hypothetical protein
MHKYSTIDLADFAETKNLKLNDFLICYLIGCRSGLAMCLTQDWLMTKEDRIGSPRSKISSDFLEAELNSFMELINT